MKRTTLLTAVLAIAVIATATPAFGMRDPGAGGMPMYNYGPTPTTPGGMPIHNSSQEAPTPPRIDRYGPNGQYADGMSLYQYVKSSPTTYLDPTGLFGKDVHQVMTQALTNRVCPRIAAQVANADQGMDENGHGAPGIVVLGWLSLGLNTLRPDVQRDYNYHFPGAGPPFPGRQHVVVQGFANTEVQNLLRDILLNTHSRRYCEPREFGKFLHMLQDSWSHGGGVPDWFGHPKGVRIVSNSGKVHITGGWWDTSVDSRQRNWQSFLRARQDTRSAIAAFSIMCPCSCQGNAGHTPAGMAQNPLLGGLLPLLVR